MMGISWIAPLLAEGAATPQCGFNSGFFKQIMAAATDWIETQQSNLAFFFIGMLLTAIAALIINLVFRRVVMQRLAKKTATQADDLLCEALGRPLVVAVFLCGLYLSGQPLLEGIEPEVAGGIWRLFLALLASTVAWAVYRTIAVLDYLLQGLARRTDNNLDDMMVNLVRKGLKIIVVSVAVLFIGQSILGINITTLLAGAGVCGLAVAFAAKETIANFFGSVMIILDKPFSVGNRIKACGVDGVVENVGFRSTRIRTHEGHLFSIPNSKMADSAIENVSGRPNIKCVFNLLLAPETEPEAIERAIAVLHEIFDGFHGFSTEQPAAINFEAIKENGMNILVAVWYQTTDWNLSRQWLQEHNLQILHRFRDEGIKLAKPPLAPAPQGAI